MWESIHPLPVTVRKEQHIYIKITKLEKILIQDSSRNINKLKVKKGECRTWKSIFKTFHGSPEMIMNRGHIEAVALAVVISNG